MHTDSNFAGSDWKTNVGAYAALVESLNQVAGEMYKEEAGKSGERPVVEDDSYHPTHDYFDTHPLVYVNNHLGKDAALRVFDEGIRKLQTEETSV